MLEKTQQVPGAGGGSPEDLAAEFLSLQAAGEPADESAFLERLGGEGAREEFRGLIAAVSRAERGLPRAITGGTLLAKRYRILEPIGSGGMGRVFSAVDEKLGCQVAVKVLDPLVQGNREREALFRKESRVLADLKHPGIVAVHDAGRDGAYTYIAMDLVLGTALSDVLDRARSQLVLGARGDRLPPRDGELLSRAIGKKTPDGRSDLVEPRDWCRSCARILLEIARTLEAAHGKKIVHRDLKPANVMITGGGNPVVLDFGLAGSPDLSTGGVTEALYGSVCYLAPEQAQSHKVGMDPRTDVYQLGLILYEMLTLRRAFPGTAIGEVLQKIESGFYELPRKVDPRVPRDLEAICTMALEVSPDRRYGGAREMREDLERWLDGQAPLASRSARWRTFVRSSRYTARRHPMLSAAAAVVLALGAGALLWSGGNDEWASLRPIRFDPAAQQTTLLPTQGEVVHAGEWLGVSLDSPRETYVYTLSIFGPVDEEKRVVAYKTSFAEDSARTLSTKRPDETWGLRVPSTRSGGPRDLFCTYVTETSAPGTVEQLLVLASPVERPEFETWMDELRPDGPGMLYSRAKEALYMQLQSTPRGEMPKSSFTPEQIEQSAKKRLAASSSAAAPSLGLPGVEERWVECRVAQK